MFGNPRQNCLGGVTGEGIASELIATKTNVLETSLLGDELRKKVSVLRVLEPGIVTSEVEVFD